MVREENPLWNFIYAIAQPNAPVDMVSAAGRSTECLSIPLNGQ